MNTKHLGLLALSFAAFAASGLRAQTMDTPTASSGPAPRFQTDLSAPYAIRWHTAGIVGDAGVNWMGAFLGGEVSYYNANPHGYATYAPSGAYEGPTDYRTEITTLNAAVRYTFSFPGLAIGPSTPLKFYLGGSAGAALVSFHPAFYSDAGYFVGNSINPYHTNGRFDYNLVGGVQIDFTPSMGLKAGYRYIDIEHTHVFATPSRLDAGALDLGLYFRF